MIVPGAIEALLQRARGEYLEMPGLRLTMPQAARLWDLDRATCQTLIHALTQERFLVRMADDSYVRTGSSHGEQSVCDSDRFGPSEEASAREPSVGIGHVNEKGDSNAATRRAHRSGPSA